MGNTLWPEKILASSSQLRLCNAQRSALAAPARGRRLMPGLGLWIADVHAFVTPAVGVVEKVRLLQQ